MKIWLITDTHFGHDKLVEYSNRPKSFGDLILKNLSIINHDDVLIHLGDFCIGNDRDWHDEFNSHIKGSTWLIKGNHDSKSDNWYMDNGWNFVGEQIVLKKYGKTILFSHIPVQKIKGIDINIHGHFHNNEHRMDEETKRFYDRSFHKLLAIEFTDYKPVLLEHFVNKLQTIKKGE